MKPRNLIIASVLLAALSGAIYYAKKHPSSGSTDTTTPVAPKLADISPAQVQSVDIAKKDGGAVSLARKDGKWVITAPQPYTADQDTVSSLLSAVNPLNADSVIEETSGDLSKYGLDKPVLSASLHESNGKTDQLQIGNDVPAASLVYAKWGSSPKVYALNSSVKTSFDKSVNDLRDKRLLTFDQAKLNSLDIKSAKGAMAFSKNSQGDWSFQKPAPYRADTFAIEDLVRKLNDAKMDLNLSAQDRDKANSAFEAGQLIATVKVPAGSGVQTLEVHKNKDDYYAGSSIVPGAYKVNSDLGQALDKGVDDFRNKKLFDFGFSDPDKIQLNSSTYVRAGTDWKLGAQTMDSGSIQAFIDKLRDLSATSFAASGFTQATATVMVQSGGYKRTEKVEFAKDGTGYLARGSGDSVSLYRLDSKPVDDMLNAGKAIKPAAKK